MNFKSSLLKLLVLPKSATLIVVSAVFLSGSCVEAGTFSSTYHCPPGLQICPPGLQICPPGL